MLRAPERFSWRTRWERQGGRGWWTKRPSRCFDCHQVGTNSISYVLCIVLSAIHPKDYFSKLYLRLAQLQYLALGRNYKSVQLPAVWGSFHYRGHLHGRGIQHCLDHRNCLARMQRRSMRAMILWAGSRLLLCCCIETSFLCLAMGELDKRCPIWNDDKWRQKSYCQTLKQNGRSNFLNQKQGSDALRFC